MWRSLLHGRRTLVVLDDVADLAQIRPLLSVPEGNAILATSRENFVLVDDCVRVPIGRLRRAEATAMFAKLVGAGRAAADVRATGRLIDLCAGLPLAVGIAGARLANRPGWAVADLVTRLEDERRRLRELEAGDVAVRSSLAVSYDLLSGGASLERTAARALRLIGMLEVADVTPYVVAALLDAPVDLAERALERLLDAHLVECDEPDRYRLHDLVRLFAREQAERTGQESSREALDRALEAYVATTRLAMELTGYPRSTLLPDIRLRENPVPLASGREAQQWLDQERSNLLSAASQGMASAADRTVRLGLALVSETFWNLLYTGHRMSALDVTRRALDAGSRLGDRVLTATGHYYHASALCLAYRYAEAFSHYERQLALYRELGDSYGEQRSLGGLAQTCNDLGRHGEAIAYAEAQLALSGAIGFGQGRFYALLMIGIARRGLGQLDQALATLEEALSHLPESVHPLRYEATLREEIGKVHLDKEDPVSARACFEKGLVAARAAKMPVAEPHFLFGLARSHRLLGELDRAADYLEQTFSLPGDGERGAGEGSPRRGEGRPRRPRDAHGVREREHGRPSGDGRLRRGRPGSATVANAGPRVSRCLPWRHPGRLDVLLK
nr:hypothetical protein GCM10020093_110720 [Planobispora longispora]